MVRHSGGKKPNQDPTIRNRKICLYGHFLRPVRRTFSLDNNTGQRTTPPATTVPEGRLFSYSPLYSPVSGITVLCTIGSSLLRTRFLLHNQYPSYTGTPPHHLIPSIFSVDSGLAIAESPWTQEKQACLIFVCTKSIIQSVGISLFGTHFYNINKNYQHFP